MGDHVVVAVWQASPGAASALQQVLAAMVEPSLAEVGCLAYSVHRSTDDPAVFMLYERYVDAAAYETHQASEHFSTIARDQGFPLLASRVRQTYEALDLTEGRLQ